MAVATWMALFIQFDSGIKVDELRYHKNKKVKRPQLPQVLITFYKTEDQWQISISLFYFSKLMKYTLMDVPKRIPNQSCFFFNSKKTTLYMSKHVN